MRARALLLALVAAALGAALALGWERRESGLDSAAITASIARMEPQARLVTTTAFVQVVSRVEDLSRLWGDARVFAVAPGKIHYSVDLTAPQLSWDAAARRLDVVVPDPRWTVEPDMKRLELIRSIGGLRTEAGIGNALEAKVLKRVAADFERLAANPQALATARDQARLSVQALLQTAVAASGPPVSVTVRFRSEAGRTS